MVTNANPRGRPLILSIIRFVSRTVPCAANASCRSFSVVLKERFPTNNLLLILFYLSNLLCFLRLFPTVGSKIATEPMFTWRIYHALKLQVIDRFRLDSLIPTE